MSNIKICVSHRIDLDSTVIKNDIFLPVYCGATFKKDNWNKDIIGDNTGDNISEKRMSFCELTVQYWAWKNLEADYYGLCHYRRYFSFSNEIFKEDIYNNVIEKYIDNNTIKKYNLNNSEFIQKEIENYDVLATTPFKVTNVGFKNIKEQYIKQPYLFEKDINILLEVINDLYPEYLKTAKKVLETDKFIPCNMFIMKKNIFNDYNKWLFDILFETEKRINIEEYSINSVRTIAHLAERMLDIFLMYKKKNKNIHIKYLQRVFYMNTFSYEQSIYPVVKNGIPIVFASSDYYVPYLYITIKSLLKFKSNDDYYDIVILNTNIIDKNKLLLKQLEKKYTNLKIRFYNVSKLIENYRFIPNNHISIEGFYRLFIPQIFKSYNKLIYLDCDLIIRTNIKCLLDECTSAHVIYATKDADYISQYYSNNIVKKYTKKTLKLERVNNYFQAGVFVFNLKLFNEKYSINDLLDFASKKEYMYMDQDILNSYLKNDIYYINMSWNVMTDCAGMRLNNIKTFAPYNIYEEYLNARKNPKIIHYAGFAKPWNRPEDDFSECFWTIARDTEVYELILSRMMNYIFHTNKNINMSSNNLVNKFIVKLMPKDVNKKIFIKSKINSIVSLFAPPGTKQRHILKKMYFKLRGWPFVE